MINFFIGLLCFIAGLVLGMFLMKIQIIQKLKEFIKKDEEEQFTEADVK